MSSAQDQNALYSRMAAKVSKLQSYYTNTHQLNTTWKKKATTEDFVNYYQNTKFGKKEVNDHRPRETTI